MPSWILLVVMCLTTLVKITSKWLMVHRFQYDDIYMFAAMVSRLSDHSRPVERACS